MSNPNDSAFPGEKNVRFGQPNDCNEGMTLRQWYAGLAMMGICANKSAWMAAAGVRPTAPQSIIAESAVEYADALLAALEPQP